MTTENKNTEMNTNDSQKKKNKKPAIFGTVLGVIAIIGFIFYMKGKNLESTDNAQLDADIISIKSSVSGYIKSINFKDNEHVKMGDTLIIIDDTDLRTRVAQAEAALENAKANMLAAQSNSSASSSNANASFLSSESIEQSINTAKARLNKAKQDFKRVENMFNAKAATLAQLDATKADLDITQAQYDAAISQYKSATAQSQGVRSQADAQKAQISLAEAMVKQREAELTLAKTQLSYATIVSPSDGIVAKRAVEAGQFISIAQPLCSTIDNTHLWITANFKETQVERIKTGQLVNIKLDAFPNIKLRGKVQSFIGATGAKFSLLPPDNSTGNFVKITQRIPVRIDIDELPKEGIDFLFPGLSAFVEIEVK
jgi:membrane fusion protein (multidrug efflux system)